MELKFKLPPTAASLYCVHVDIRISFSLGTLTVTLHGVGDEV